jgi:hypothetical protein
VVRATALEMVRETALARVWETALARVWETALVEVQNHYNHPTAPQPERVNP